MLSGMALGQTMKQIVVDYPQDYIKRALESHELEAPDKSKANGTYEALIGLHLAHQTNGVEGAKSAWETLKKMRPDLAMLENRLVIHADGLDELPEPKHLDTDYPIYEGAFNMIYGPSGSGKSFVALDLASKIAVNDPVMYIAGEGLFGYNARWKAWKHHHGIATAKLYFFMEALQIMDDMQLMNFIKTMGTYQPSLIIVDTFATSAVGLDENSAKDVGVFIHRVKHIGKELDCSTLVVHHTNKEGGMRGSNALYSAADAVIATTQNDGVIKLTNSYDQGGKNKYGATDWNKFYRLLPVKGDDYEGAVLVETEQIIDDLSVEGNELSDTQYQILETIQTYDSGVNALTVARTTEIPQATVYRNLKILLKSDYISYKEPNYIITASGEKALGVSNG